LTGLPVKFEEVLPENKPTVCKMAIHSCCNGPVGVKKTTTFPTIPGQVKIAQFVNVSNASWAAFCEVVAKIINEKKPDLQCATKLRNGNLWPLAGQSKK